MSVPASPRDRQKASIDAKRRDLQAEEDHRFRIGKAFGGDDGLAVLEWILSDLCGFWDTSVDSETLGKFNVGRTLFNHISLANPDIAVAILQRRRQAAESVRMAEIKRLEKMEKET